MTTQRGFTLIELLAVIIVITILMGALISTGVLRAFTRGEEAATTMVMNEIQVALDEVERDLGSYPSGDWQKFRRFAKTHARKLRGMGDQAENAGTETNSGIEIVYLVLKATGSRHSIDPKYVKDTDGDGFKEFIDAWGVPLVYLCNNTDDAQALTMIIAADGAEDFEETRVNAVPSKDDANVPQGGYQILSAGPNGEFETIEEDDLHIYGKR